MKSFLAARRLSPASMFHVTRRFRSTSSWKKSQPPQFKSQAPDRETKGSTRKKNYSMFQQLVESRFERVLVDMGKWTAEHSEYRSFKVTSQQHLIRESNLFLLAIKKAFARASLNGEDGRDTNPLFWNLRNAFVKGDTQGLGKELKYSFQAFLMRSAFPKATSELQAELADLRYPFEWFPATRVMQRTVHLHVGPTNSGKTYHALKALENAKTGIYAGPLRLLAYEIYSRFQAKGLPVALLTGEEQRIPENVDEYFTSCTVEMSPIGKKVDVAVIDEIQMIGDPHRGAAWTQAVLGIQAKELHLCGEERTVDLIKEMCERIGDKCIIHHYKRLSPLRTMKESLDNDFKHLQKGDCVVTFSRVSIHSLKNVIEKETGRRCAVVYGSLPPETRAQQAALFNEPNNDYDFLVASDAIGMGLNLEIKRVIFESSTKFDGIGHRTLTIPEVKQIGGRAGRYKTANQAIQTAAAQPGAQSGADSSPAKDPETTAASPAKWGTPGYVTTLDEQDLEHIAASFHEEAPPIQAAAIQPPSFIIERFCSFFPPQTPFSFILSRLREISRISNPFFMAALTDEIGVAEAIQDYPMSIADRCTLLYAPVTIREEAQQRLIAAMARCISTSTSGHLLDIPEIDLEALDVEETDPAFTDKTHLLRLESLHKAIVLYLWLSYRFEGIFVSQQLAFHVNELLQAKIERCLDQLNFTFEARKAFRARQRHSATRRDLEMGKYLEHDEVEVVEAGFDAALPGQDAHEKQPVAANDDEAKPKVIEYPSSQGYTTSNDTVV
ncbi:ATP-dependent RNA helicase [Rhypophila decipiens]